MEKNFIDTALEYLSLNSQSYDYQLGFWKKVIKSFPSNKEKILQAINSRLFDWKFGSNFSEKFMINPVKQAIAESEHILDLIYPNPLTPNFVNGVDPAEFLTSVYLYYLSTKPLAFVLKLHPLLNFVVSKYSGWESNRLVKKILKSNQGSNEFNFIQNSIFMFSETFFVKSRLFPRAHINPTDFWDLISLGIVYPLSDMKKHIESKDADFFQDKAIIVPIFYYVKHLKLSTGLKSRFKAPNQQRFLINYLNQLKTDTSLLVLLKLR
jgi:hypothetical protein